MSRKQNTVKRVILAEGFALPVEEKHFDQVISTASKPVLVDFWAEWCGPCDMQAPILDEFAAKYADEVQVIKVEVDKAPLLQERFDIASIPTMVVFVDGKEQERLVGARSMPHLEKDLASFTTVQTKSEK
jgi:thioredoxin 1